MKPRSSEKEGDDRGLCASEEEGLLLLALAARGRRGLRASLMGFLGYALLLAVISAAASARSAEQEADLISWDELPGAPEDLKGKFDMYSGYIDILESEKKIFYWFVESQGFNPEDAPVVLWTNGGPGCSGFLGLLTEHGPFSVRDEGEQPVANVFW